MASPLKTLDRQGIGHLICHDQPMKLSVSGGWPVKRPVDPGHDDLKGGLPERGHRVSNRLHLNGPQACASFN